MLWRFLNTSRPAVGLSSLYITAPSLEEIILTQGGSWKDTTRLFWYAAIPITSTPTCTVVYAFSIESFTFKDWICLLSNVLAARWALVMHMNRRLSCSTISDNTSCDSLSTSTTFLSTQIDGRSLFGETRAISWIFFVSNCMLGCCFSLAADNSVKKVKGPLIQAKLASLYYEFFLIV